MNDLDKEKGLPESEVGKPCPRIAELEGSENDPRLVQHDVGWSKEQYCTLAESMNEGLAMIDKSMQITYVNSQLCEMVGYSQDELIGSSATDFHIMTAQKIIEEQIFRVGDKALVNPHVRGITIGDTVGKPLMS